MGLPAGWIPHIPGVMRKRVHDRIFSIRNDKDFWGIAREIYIHQCNHNTVYRDYVKGIGADATSFVSPADIPFLPVELFRNQRIITGDYPPEKIFNSSGTTASLPAKHFVADLRLYEDSFLGAFSFFYGDPGEYIIIVLLPSYTERTDSSLVYMADVLIKRSKHRLSGFYDRDDDLLRAVKDSVSGGRKVFLLGVSYALLDLAEKHTPDLGGVIVMETGGMKGRRREMIRSELHDILCGKFNISSVHSEYGMTELMSQAYSSGRGVFYSPPWMKVVIRDPWDPLTLINEPGRTGGINIIDLANVNSCSFIATSDLGRAGDDGGFEVLGRFDNSDIRGCNLLAEQVTG
jgi:hypothetical protein